jgi:hypothetical protein
MQMTKELDFFKKEAEKLSSRSLIGYSEVLHRFQNEQVINAIEDQIVETALINHNTIDIWLNTFKNYPKVVKKIQQKTNENNIKI